MRKSYGRFAIFLLGLSATVSCSTPSTTPLADSAPPDVEAIASSAPLSIDGSSTVYPITLEMAERFKQAKTDSPEISVNFSGTGGGFEKFCAGETDISDASRPISLQEMAACKANGIEYIELPVAFDALTVVVNAENTWAEEITLAELQTLWQAEAEGEITRWNQIRADWPDEPIALYGPGEDSGTFDYFTEVVIGEEGASRTDYTASEDDDELVEGVRSEVNALSYFGFAYYRDAEKSLNALAVDSGNGPVEPTGETIRSGEYQPLSRPLFIYVKADALEENPALSSFVEYYLANARTVVDDIGYEPLPNEVYAIALDHLTERKVGSVFAGKAQFDLTIEQLLEKEAAF
ncbi:PstS family phosphate ABC transporter substrate-binding protein [cf. Phormidesmis sp. LEGE 11477]|uniref:PstS family phosphate ABC transporter substrate-binding protein n=1 Tax=cf. Phormidesmis sp. LEGE 11477 TaxID=1828680 RepID=UPI00187E1A6A|nr:PstS family phosphate ABC transporter substrate-binding protein [cf. Phormidesmis sp. LEGE 11477]MBE9060377.1 PstS family phosphate ABC transporter substrate-binding protein [cf. Phormidesmis sp. LEGE 11477]